MRLSYAALCLSLATCLLGCPKDRLWTLRVHEPGKVVAGGRVLGKVRVDARVTTTCPGGDEGPPPVFAPTRDGAVLQAKTFHGLRNDCTFTVSVPGGASADLHGRRALHRAAQGWVRGLAGDPRDG